MRAEPRGIQKFMRSPFRWRKSPAIHNSPGETGRSEHSGKLRIFIYPCMTREERDTHVKRRRQFARVEKERRNEIRGIILCIRRERQISRDGSRDETRVCVSSVEARVKAGACLQPVRRDFHLSPRSSTIPLLTLRTLAPPMLHRSGGSTASDRAIEERGGQRKTACHDSVSLADPWRKSAPMESKSMHGRALPRVFRQVRAG